jgi:hypothetical protein
MARKKKVKTDAARKEFPAQRLSELAAAKTIAGVPGPGRWLIVEYSPTALFSLKSSLATSSVGKSLLIPTPYSIKMAFVDAAFRARFSDSECAHLLRALVAVEIRIAPPEAACVTHTFVKVRTEPHKPNPNPLRPYIDSIAYREVVHHQGVWRWAFDLATGDDVLAESLVTLAPHVAYIGKRGSFIQFVGLSRLVEIDSEFTQPIDNHHEWMLPPRAHIALLDDFGPEADLPVLSSFTSIVARREKHRRLVQTIVPTGLVNTGPGFSEYRTK